MGANCIGSWNYCAVRCKDIRLSIILVKFVEIINGNKNGGENSAQIHRKYLVIFKSSRGCKTLKLSFGCKYYGSMERTEISKGNLFDIKL